MRNIAKLFIGLLLLHSASSLLARATFGKTTFRNRSTGLNKIIQEAGTLHFLNPYDIDCLNGFFGVTAGYESSFDRDEIGKYLFFNGTNSMTIGTVGSSDFATTAIALPGVDIYAENLFLNNNLATGGLLGFNSSIIALPQVQNVFVDLNLRINLDEWIEGLYFDCHAPVTWTRWDMNIHENLLTTGSVIVANTLGNASPTPSPVSSVKAALQGQVINIATFPDLKQPLLYGKVDGAQTKTRLADVETALGYNFWACEYSHLGLELRAIFPTGNQPDAEFWFEPLAGNGHQYGLGAGTTFHYELWNNCCDSSFSSWANGKIYHMFGAKQRRIFDLNNADGSQNIGSNRLFIKKFTTAGVFSEILFGPNVLALQCKVSNDIQAEAALLFDYQRGGFTLDVGYKFWCRTNDKVTVSQQLPVDTFAIKGVTQGTGSTSASDSASNTKINGMSTADTTLTFISNNNLSITSAEQPTALSHTAFFHVNYAWECYDYTPFVGAGAEIELSGSDNNALDQWAGWLKAGFAFS